MLEYTEAVRGWYLRASKKEKGRILDEFTEVVGCLARQLSGYWVDQTDPVGTKSVGVLGNMVLLPLRHSG